MPNPLEPILVPYDGSEFSQYAAAYARLLAAASGARTVLAYALPSGAFSWDPGGAAYQASVAEGSAFLVEEARHFHTPVQTHLMDGVPSDAIVSEAESLRAGLVVMGCAGRSPATGILMGSTARYVLRASTRPVMVVHRGVPAIRRIVAGVEVGPAGERVTRMARLVADATGAAITMVNAVDVDRDLRARPEQYGIPASVWSEAIAAHQASVFGPLRAVAGPSADELVAFGSAADELRRVATEQAAELIVVGRRGTSGRDVDAWASVAFSLAIRGPFATLVV
ncbi:MAG: universal stress protein [Myxococcota bacterium]